MSFTHDVIKIKYINEGYLPAFPYHLISDEEMLEAFFSTADSLDYFHDEYRFPYSSSDTDPIVQDLLSKYQALEACIANEIALFNESEDADKTLPDWIYSYMLGSAVSQQSAILDIHDYLVLMDADNMNDIIEKSVYEECYNISAKWLRKYSNTSNRVPTIFAEPHVIKSLRLSQ